MLQLSTRVVHAFHAFRWLAPLVRAAGLVAHVLTERQRHTAARRELQWLDERALHDIGLSHRAAAEWPQSRCDAS